MEKINSESAWIAFCKNASIKSKFSQSFDLPGGVYAECTAWWAQREEYRLKEVYETSSITEWINQHYNVFSHVSLEDRNMVAYTYDAAAGEADKQTRTTIAKLLTKLFPILSQKYVQELSAQHLAEVNPILEFISGEAITEAYKNDFNGHAACMSKNFGKWHPTQAYQTNEISLAVCKDVNGKIIARTLVYVNGDDKRYTRTYGSPIIKKALDRIGFVNKAFTGVKLNTVILDKGSSSVKVAVPYIDSSTARATYETSLVALIDNQLCILTEHQRHLVTSSKLANITEGFTWLTNVKSSEYVFTCPLSDITLNSLLCAVPTKLTFINNKEVLAIASAVPSYFVSAHNHNTGNAVYISTDDAVTVFEGFGNKAYVVNNHEELTNRRYLKLSEKYYKNAYSRFSVVDKDGDRILKADSISIYDKDVVTYVHKDVFNKKHYIKCHQDIYCTKDTKYLLTTSNKKVLPNVHTYYIDIDGVVTLRKPAFCDLLLGKYYYSGNREKVQTFVDKIAFEYLQESVNKSNVFLFRDVFRRLQEKQVNWHSLYVRTYTATIHQTMTKAVEHLTLGNPVRSYLVNTLAAMNAIDFN